MDQLIALLPLMLLLWFALMVLCVALVVFGVWAGLQAFKRGEGE